MTFVSLPFFIFVAALLLVYYLTPRRAQWVVLLAASCLFYWLNSKWLVLVLLATSLATYAVGRLIQRVNDRNAEYVKAHPGLTPQEKKQRKEAAKRTGRRILWLGVALVLGALLFLKYFNFFGQNANRLFRRVGLGNAIPTLHLLLPMGISFYTLQAIAYMVDVYRGKVRADANPAKFMLFLSFFPQIVQGPIARHHQLAGQLYEGHGFDYRRLCFGAQLMLWGLIKKLIISERIAVPAGFLFRNYRSLNGPILFLAALMYGLQVYTDFSGGMDIARGVAQMLGIDLEQNFKQPYFSTSIEDFWRRWHITMGGWMRDYVFYPLSMSKPFTNLSRKSRKLLGQFAGKRLPAFLSMFIVYFLVGFWHGAEWKYVAFGIWNGTFIMSGILLEGIYGKLRAKCGIHESAVTWRLFRMARTLVIVSLGRFFSGAANLRSALGMFRRVFINWRNITFLTNGALLKLGLNTANWFILLLFILLLFYVDSVHEKGVSLRVVFARQPLVFRWAIYVAAVIAVLVFGCYGVEYDAASFIYEQF